MRCATNDSWWLKAIPGKKTDRRDAGWLAELLQHGLLRGSFIPPEPIRGVRDLTRYRVNLAQECNRIANRIQKVLEEANIKLASMATDPLGASGRSMLKAMIQGEQDQEKLAEMARGLLRRKIPELRLALRPTAPCRGLACPALAEARRRSAPGRRPPGERCARMIL